MKRESRKCLANKKKKLTYFETGKEELRIKLGEVTAGMEVD
jgi:hypothetical protein